MRKTGKLEKDEKDRKVRKTFLFLKFILRKRGAVFQFARGYLDNYYILKHFRNAPFDILLFLSHGWVGDIFLVIFYIRVQ